MNLRNIVLAAIVAVSGISAVDSRAADSKPLSAGALRASFHQTLRSTARSTDYQASAGRLLELYRALEADTELVNDDRLPMQQIVRGRLEKLASQIRKQGNRADAEARNVNSADQGLQEFLDALVERSTKPANPAAVNRPAVLAQQRGIANAPVGRFAGQNPLPAAPPVDYGQDLVELIEATIAPSSWDTNGGAGTIRYFGPLRVLVVRQTSEVHGQLGDLLPQLRD
jgi:hypothetical protein